MTDPARGLTRQVLRWALPKQERDEVIQDLDERFASKVDGLGSPGAARWLTVQSWTLIAWGLRERTLDVLANMGGGEVMGTIWADMKAGFRALIRNPGYGLAAVTTLALGVGGNTAVFSVVDAVLLTPLPYAEADELIAIHETRVGQSWWSAAPSNAMAWRERSRAFEDVAWGQARRATLVVGGGDPESVRLAAVSTNMLDLLEVPAARGRGFQPGEDVVGAAPVAALTHDMWVRRFASDPDILGSQMELDGIAHTVVGVLPSGQEPAFLGAHEILVPRVFSENEILTRGRVLRAIGRLAPGTDIDAATVEMKELAATLDEESPAGTAKGWGAELVSLRDEIVGPVRKPLLVLLGAVGFVLLIACVNLSNLMMVRGSARATDLAVRASLGAGRAGLVRHLLAESLLIALLGGAMGLGIAIGGTRLLLTIDPTALPRLAEVTVDGRVLLFTGAMSGLAALLFGLVPAVRVSRVDIAGRLPGEWSTRRGG